MSVTKVLKCPVVQLLHVLPCRFGLIAYCLCEPQFRQTVTNICCLYLPTMSSCGRSGWRSLIYLITLLKHGPCSSGSLHVAMWQISWTQVSHNLAALVTCRVLRRIFLQIKEKVLKQIKCCTGIYIACLICFVRMMFNTGPQGISLL